MGVGHGLIQVALRVSYIELGRGVHAKFVASVEISRLDLLTFCEL